MQDEINEQSMTIAGRVAETTATELKRIVDKLLAEIQAQTGKTLSSVKGDGIKHGKQTMEQLAKHNAGLSSVELKDPNLRQLYKTMKQNGVDFAPVKDGKGRYTLFFKGRDADALTHAFSQYTKKVTERAVRPSIRSTLAAMAQAAKTLNDSRDKVKNLDKGARGI
jgi:vacuolar-type H+-ATPase subunit E/Vma4